MTASSPEGVRRCIAAAIDQSGLRAEAIDYVNADATATGNDAREVAHLRCALQLDGEGFPWLNATKSMIGHAPEYTPRSTAKIFIPAWAPSPRAFPRSA